MFIRARHEEDVLPKQAMVPCCQAGSNKMRKHLAKTSEVRAS